MKNQALNRMKRLKTIEPIWWILSGCIILFAVTSDYFLSLANVLNIFLQTSVIGVMALGMTFLMISGFFDLSVGSVMALSAVTTVIAEPFVGVPLAIIAGLLSGVVVGFINGFLVVKAGINAFVTTLGSMIGIRGIVYLLTEEQPIISTNLNLQILGNNSLFFVPIPFYIFVLIAVLFHFILKISIHGKNTFAIGGNSEAAINVGIPINKHLFLNFVICSFCAALGGVISASRMGSATPILGLNTAVLVITAVVLGGTKLNGGYGSIVGTVGGVFVLGIIQNGLNQLNVQVYYQILINGVILILVIYFDSRVDRLSKKHSNNKEVKN